MGTTLSTFISPPTHQIEYERYPIKIMGPTRAGKTSILQKIQGLGNVVDQNNYIPTLACDFFIIRSTQDNDYHSSTAQKRLRLTLFDTSDHERFSVFNASFLRHTHGIIFVVDSSPREGQTRDQYAAEATRSLYRAIDNGANNIQDQPLLVFVNKQDRPNAMTAEEVIELLRLEEMFLAGGGGGGGGEGRRWFVQEASAIQGEGITVGFAWLVAQIQERQANSGCSLLVKSR
ncbi:hypothetical protein BG015_009070 [Linnemannia schmuckeri]|uniref:ADP-ribosylation factor n=1 Tax=Linnemannia schmuckeri TaxID=64567 RepID=A0A9P5RZI4_9FUNG|nr:hypothetical protein BG015_009070 [Linnemannia schmuckeri]